MTSAEAVREETNKDLLELLVMGNREIQVIRRRGDSSIYGDYQREATTATNLAIEERLLG